MTSQSSASWAGLCFGDETTAFNTTTESSFTRALYGSELSITFTEKLPSSLLTQLQTLWLKHCEHGGERGLELFYLACGLITRAMDVASSKEMTNRKHARVQMLSQLRALRRVLDEEFPTLDEEDEPRERMRSKFPALCPACKTIRFKNWIVLAGHVRACHTHRKGETGRPARCWCNRIFKSDQGLAQHLNRLPDLRQHYREWTASNALEQLGDN